MIRQTYFYAAGTLFTMVAATAINILVGRALGPGPYGVFALSRTAVQLLVLFAPLGMDLGLQRFLAQGQQNGRPVADLLRFARLSALAVTLISLTVIMLGGGQLLEDAYNAPGLANALAISFAAAPFTVDALLLFTVGRVVGNMAPYSRWILFTQPILRLLLIAVAIAAGTGITGVLWGGTVGVLLSWIGYSLTEHRLRDTSADIETPLERRREVLQLTQTSLWLGISVFCYGLMRTADTLILGLFLPIADVGRYAAISFVAQTVQSLTLAVSQGLGAKVATIAVTAQNEVVPLIDDASRRAIPFSLFLFGGIAVFGPDLHHIFGPGFTVSPATSFFLSLGYLISGVLGIVGYALSMTGGHRQESTLILFGGLALLAAAFLGASWGGVEGVAIATCAMFILVNIARLFAVRSKFGRWPIAPVMLIGAAPAWLLAVVARQLPQGTTLHPQTVFLIGVFTYSIGFMAIYMLAGAIWRRRSRSTEDHAQARGRVTIVAFHFAEYSARLFLALNCGQRAQMIGNRNKLIREAPRHLVEAVHHLNNIIWYDDRNRLCKVASALRIFLGVIRFRPALIIAHETGVPLPTLITIACSFFAPVRLIVHDPSPHVGADAVIARKGKFWINALRHVASSYIVHGEYCQSELQKVLGDTGKPIIAVAHGVLLEPEPEQIEVPIERNILFFGRLEKYKGLPMLFEVGDILVSRLDNFTLRIIGHGTEASTVAHFSASRPYVKFDEGYASPEAVITAMQEAKIVVLPYDEGTQSGVLSSALANGRPVVATAVGALKEVVTADNGLLVTPGDIRRFATCVEDLLIDGDAWQRLSEGALRTAKTAMNWERIAHRMTSEPSEVPR